MTAADSSSKSKRWLESLPAYPADRYAGSGIVICAGGAAMFTNAYVLLHLLRRTLKCTLPVEVWYLGRAEMSPRMLRLLTDLDVTCVDGMEVECGIPRNTLDGWRLKSCALIGSAFQKVLMLDADQVPTRDPTDIFIWPEFVRTGAVLWPDIVDIDPRNPIWKFCGLDSRQCVSVESGQLLIDKKRHWRALNVAVRLNAAADEVYRIVYGDKDTFLLGMLLTGEEFSMPHQRPAIDLGRCLYQYDFQGQVLFQHRTNAKWTYTGKQVSLSSFQQTDACDLALEDLRQLWNGLVFNPPDRGPMALACEETLSKARDLHLLCPGSALHLVELLSDGEIGAGRREDVMNWHCVEEDGGVALILFDAFAPRWRLLSSVTGRWEGCNLLDPSVTVFGAIGIDLPATTAPIRHSELWREWPRDDHYLLRDDGRL